MCFCVRRYLNDVVCSVYYLIHSNKRGKLPIFCHNDGTVFLFSLFYKDWLDTVTDARIA